MKNPLKHSELIKSPKNYPALLNTHLLSDLHPGFWCKCVERGKVLWSLGSINNVLSCRFPLPPPGKSPSREILALARGDTRVFKQMLVLSFSTTWATSILLPSRQPSGRGEVTIKISNIINTYTVPVTLYAVSQLALRVMLKGLCHGYHHRINGKINSQRD